METRRDETSPLIIEEEKSCPHRPSIVATSCYHLNPSWRRPARGRMKAMSRQNRLHRGSWEWGHFEIVCAQHIDGVGDDGGEVSDGGFVENSHALPRNLPIHWNVTNASNRTATGAICLVIVADFFIHSKYLHVRFFIFLSYFFWIYGLPPDMETFAIRECSTEYLTTQQVGFVTEFHLHFLVFPVI